MSTTTQRFFPLDAATPDLDGSDRRRGLFGFGEPPRSLGKRCQASGSLGTGWNPVIKSLGYSSLQPTGGVGPAPVADVQVRLRGNLVSEGELMGSAGGLAVNTPWQQTVFDELGVRFVYISDLCVPVSDASGSPWGLQFITTGRTAPSMVVIEWDWALFLRDVDHAGQVRIAADLLNGIRGGPP